MIPKPLTQVILADIQVLLENQIREGRTLDYKRDLPGASDDNKRELLADISSFANAAGGDLIFGIEETAGAPTAIPGVASANIDTDIQRINNVLQTGLEPRLGPVESHPIEVASGRWVLILRVRQSWNAPHRVMRDWKFYARNSTGKYPLDVTELRNAFLLSEGQAERIRRFRDDRLAKIISSETPVALVEGAIAVLHLVPLTQSSPFETSDATDGDRFNNLPPPGSTGWSRRRNLDGPLNYSQGVRGASGYTQLFRNGAIEFVVVFEPRGEQRFLASTYLEQSFADATRRALVVYASLGIEPPIYLFFSVLGARTYSLAVSQRAMFFRDPPSLDRDNLILPELIVEDLNRPTLTLLRPVFDMLWQAYGYDGSLNYDGDGNWRQHQ